jgi:hypothetical protein
MLSRIAVRIHQWRHAGEENAVAIYAGRWKTPLRKGIAAIVFAVLLLEPDWDVLRMLIPSFIAILLLVLIRDQRRAIIFTVGTVAYRPGFGEPRVVAFRKIVAVRRAMASSGPRGEVRGIALDLPDGFAEVWPLVFDAQSEIVERLAAAASQPVTGEWSR